MRDKLKIKNSSFSKSRIVALGSEIQALQKEAVRQTMAYCEPQVEQIIKTKNQDKNTIDHALDALLEVAFDDAVLLLYKKLCRYYYNIDPQATAEHISFYRDMWDSNEDENSD